MSDIVIDHLGIIVSDYTSAKAFYAAALAPLGVKVLAEFPMDDGNEVCGLGKEKPILWLSPGGKTEPHLHFALAAQSRAEVDAFYAAAIAGGAKDNGAPGIRAHYHQNYYAAYVIDADGHNFEVVSHRPE